MTTRITSSDCGCYTVDGEQKLWCAHHVSGMQETIVARERELRDQRHTVREAEQSARDVIEERDSLREELRHMHRDWVALARKVLPEQPTHYCCMHMRWETRDGAEV